MQVERHLAGLRYEHVPYYAVRFEQAVGLGLSRRGTLVSQSPTMIAQWLDAQSVPDAGPVSWWAEPYPSRNRARRAADAWLAAP